MAIRIEAAEVSLLLKPRHEPVSENTCYRDVKIDGSTIAGWIGPKKCLVGRCHEPSQKSGARLRGKAGLPDARLHDFRHTTDTFAAQAGLNAFMVRDLLGHKALAMTGRYVERATDPLREAATSVSNRVARALDGGDSGEVVPLPGRKQKSTSKG